MKWRKSKHIGINQRAGKNWETEATFMANPRRRPQSDPDRWLPWQHFYAQINFAIAGSRGVRSSESTPWIWGGCLGALGAVSLPLHYIKFIPNLRAAGKHFIWLVWRCSTLAYQILLAGRQIVQQQQHRTSATTLRAK